MHDHLNEVPTVFKVKRYLLLPDSGGHLNQLQNREGLSTSIISVEVRKLQSICYTSVSVLVLSYWHHLFCNNCLHNVSIFMPYLTSIPEVLILFGFSPIK